MPVKILPYWPLENNSTFENLLIVANTLDGHLSIFHLVWTADFNYGKVFCNLFIKSQQKLGKS